MNDLPPIGVNTNPGTVYLIGAGPGDPGLLTIRGVELLARADVIVYDYLANSKFLDLARKAKHIYVGKMASRHAMTQEQINQLLVDEAKAGKTVVRLKGGDPFVFGRGGEEAIELAKNEIPFEIVPGITSAIAAAAYAGIPVTHRDFNSSFTLITGHEKDDAPDSNTDWATLAKLPCLAFYMGLSALPHIRDNLIKHGKDPITPAAAIQWGTTHKQKTITAPLMFLPERVAEANWTPPVIIIVGLVVQLRNKINWFETRPLFGQTIAVTRTRHQASDLASSLSSYGAHVIETPTLQITPPPDPTPVHNALRIISNYNWVIFTSPNGVVHTKTALREIGLDARVFGKCQIAAVGAATADAIRIHLAIEPDLVPHAFNAESLAHELETRNQVAGQRFLMLRADIAREQLRDRLMKSALEVSDIPIYETRSVDSLPEQFLHALDAHEINWVTFTSSSTARNLLNLLGVNYLDRLKGVKIASMGPVTTKTLEELCLKPTVQASEAQIPNLVQAMLRYK